MKDSFSFILVLLALHPSFAQKIQILDDFPELEKVIHSAVTKLEHREMKDGSILLFQHGEKNSFTGWRKQVRETGKLRSLEEYKNGKPHGLYIYWWKNGVKAEEKNFHNGISHGLWESWYPNGQKQLEQSVENGKLHGPASRWYSNGQKKDDSLYQNGRVISIVVWKPNGEKCSDTKLINGNGVWVRYKEDGTESWRSNYRNGQYLLN